MTTFGGVDVAWSPVARLLASGRVLLAERVWLHETRRGHESANSCIVN